MALVLRNLYHGYFWIFDELSDPRTNEILPLSPFGIAAIILLYVHIVKKWGPTLMENRQPYNLRNIIIVYDIIQIIANVYISIESFRHMPANKFDCSGIDFSNNPEALDQLNVFRNFFFLKLLDLVETVFFVLRKSYRQISFLHVYHHGGMILCSYLAYQFFGGNLSLWLPFLNCFVHVVMFVYYLMTAIDSSWKQSFVFKRTLTQIQLIQFAMFIMIYSSVFFRDCDYLKFPSYLFVPQNFFMICLFGEFYVKTYMFKKTKPLNDVN